MDYKEAERRNSFPDIEEDVFIPGHLGEEDMLDLKKQELTCISEEGIADMGLPDNLLAELEILENITSCNKVSRFARYLIYYSLNLLFPGGELPDAERVRAEPEQGE